MPTINKQYFIKSVTTLESLQKRFTYLKDSDAFLECQKVIQKKYSRDNQKRLNKLREKLSTSEIMVLRRILIVNRIMKKTFISPINNISYGILYKRTLEKERLIKSAGYNLITKWGV